MSIADLLQELDSTLELAYTVKESLDQGETLRMALTSVGIGADTVERYNSLLQDMLQQVLPIAQRICKFSKGGPDSGFRLRTKCTTRTLEGLSKLRKSLQRVAMQHRDTKDAGKEVCDDLCDLVQTELCKLQNNIATASQWHPDRMTRKAGKSMKNCVEKACKTAAKRKDKIRQDLKWQSRAAASKQTIQFQTAEGPAETRACMRDLDDSLRKALHDRHKLGQSKQNLLCFQLWDKVQPFKPHSDAPCEPCHQSQNHKRTSSSIGQAKSGTRTWPSRGICHTCLGSQ